LLCFLIVISFSLVDINLSVSLSVLVVKLPLIVFHE
jgi:hypothetical protein